MTGNVTQVTLGVSKLLCTRNGDVSTKNVGKQIGILLVTWFSGNNLMWKTYKVE